MKDRRSSIHQTIFYALIIIEIFSILYVSFQRHIDIEFKNEALYSMNDNWLHHTDSGNLYSLTLPTVVKPEDNNTVTISNKIPDSMEHISSIGILTTHQSIIATLDGQVIYTRIVSSNPKRFFNVPTGSVWDIIPLKPGSQGKTLTLVLSSEYPEYVGRINEIHAGSKASILLHTIDHYGIGFFLSVLICVMGTFLIFLYVFIKRLLRADKSLYYLGCLSIISGIWLLMESNLTQLFLSNAYLITTISYLSLMTLPIPILLHINLFENYHFKKLNIWLIYILITNDIIIILLQFANIFDFHETSHMTRTLLLLILGIAMFTLCLELIKYKNKEVKVFTFAVLFLFLFSVIEIFVYQHQTTQITGEYFRIGFYCFLFILAWDGIKKIVDYVKLSERATHYRQLAYRDSLTNCRNRIAYEMDIEKIDTQRDVTIFMADMNNMKEINDTYGHQIGDEVIILCSQCLLNVFGSSVYRIGGDEYLSIQYGLSQEEINCILLAFQEECIRANEGIPYRFVLSIGYATYDPLTDMTIHDTIKRADNNMYEVKDKMKKGQSQE
ncbi:MAG: diguanylate cyclase [Herbinix sp.]|jgi:diguanylate cyclase (GGDEF)-like protein|nr:diguanylate cyclase [Herbinix sp.]